MNKLPKRLINRWYILSLIIALSFILSFEAKKNTIDRFFTFHSFRLDLAIGYHFLLFYVEFLLNFV